LRGTIGFILKASGSKLLLLSMFVFCLANYPVLLSIRGRITRQIGVPLFDFGGDLPSAEVFEQLPLYTEGTRTLYRLFFHQAKLALLPIVLGGLLPTLALGICLRWQRRTGRGLSQARAEAGLIGETV
jgi:hypothetical protein